MIAPTHTFRHQQWDYEYHGGFTSSLRQPVSKSS
jgi:hypothetical protein